MDGEKSNLHNGNQKAPEYITTTRPLRPYSYKDTCAVLIFIMVVLSGVVFIGFCLHKNYMQMRKNNTLFIRSTTCCSNSPFLKALLKSEEQENLNDNVRNDSIIRPYMRTFSIFFSRKCNKTNNETNSIKNDSDINTSKLETLFANLNLTLPHNIFNITKNTSNEDLPFMMDSVHLLKLATSFAKGIAPMIKTLGAILPPDFPLPAFPSHKLPNFTSIETLHDGPFKSELKEFLALVNNISGKQKIMEESMMI